MNNRAISKLRARHYTDSSHHTVVVISLESVFTNITSSAVVTGLKYYHS